MKISLYQRLRVRSDSCSAGPIMMFKCHCHDCQQVTGGGFVTGLLVPAPGFRLTKGQLRTERGGQQTQARLLR